MTGKWCSTNVAGIEFYKKSSFKEAVRCGTHGRPVPASDCTTPAHTGLLSTAPQEWCLFSWWQYASVALHILWCPLPPPHSAPASEKVCSFSPSPRMPGNQSLKQMWSDCCPTIVREGRWDCCRDFGRGRGGGGLCCKDWRASVARLNVPLQKWPPFHHPGNFSLQKRASELLWVYKCVDEAAQA